MAYWNCRRFGYPKFRVFGNRRYMLDILVCRTLKDVLVQLKIAMLKQQHAEILSAVTELTNLLNGSFEEAASQLGTARTNLARLIAKHLKTEEEELHAPLRARGLTAQIPAFAEIAAETRDLRLNYSAHIGEWHARTIQANWPGYIASARRLHAALERLTKREEEGIYPAAQRLLSELR